MAEGLALTAPVKLAAAEYYSTTGDLPDTSELTEATGVNPSTITGKYVSSVSWYTATSFGTNGMIQINFGPQAHSALDGKAFFYVQVLMLLGVRFYGAVTRVVAWGRS